MKVVVAIDSFKGCLSSVEANEAAAAGVRSACPDADVRQVVVSDGGEGFLEAFQAAVGGEMVEVPVLDPLEPPSRPVICFVPKGWPSLKWHRPAGSPC